MRARKKSEITEATVLLDRDMATSLFSLGYQTLDRVARECNGRIKIGKRVLYHRQRLEEYFNSLCEEV